MKKNRFLLAALLTALANGGLFYLASARAMRAGIPGADNQAALLFIPLLWIAAGLVLVLLAAWLLVIGRRIPPERVIRPAAALRKEDGGLRLRFLIPAGILMLMGYGLFASFLSAAYALSGGALLVLLRAWQQAART